MTFGNAMRRPDAAISAKVAESQLAMLLASASDEKIAAMTVVSLSKMYRVQPKKIEQMLVEQQGRRQRANGI